MERRTDLQILLTCGCSMRIDGKKYTFAELQILASYAHQGGGMLTITNAKNIKNDHLYQIASLGKNNVLFEFCT